MYKDVVLNYNKIGLTIPFPIAQIKDLDFSISLKVKHTINKRPRFSFEKMVD
jgi:hypothetical protein